MAHQSQASWSSDPAIQQYLSSLPALIQESIYQCGMQFSSLEQLKDFTNALQQDS